MGLKTTTWQSLIKARRILIGSLLTALALIPAMTLKAQEQITLVAAAEQNQWKITVEADTEV